MPKVLDKILTVVLVIILVASAGVLGWEFYQMHKADVDIERVRTIIETVTEDKENPFDREAFQKLKSENEDLAGYLLWENYYMECPIMQTPQTEYYLYKNFFKEYSEMGTPFMDSENRWGDQNVLIFGHNNSYKEGAAFSPINDLALSQSTYEENSTFRIFTEEGVRTYGITHIYYFSEEEYNQQIYEFQLRTISEEEWEPFMEFPTQRNQIRSIHGTLEYGNRFVTLQTCRRWHSDERTIVLAKELSFEPYKNN